MYHFGPIKYLEFADVRTMRHSKSAGLSLPTNLMKKIDAERGDVPRSRFLLRLLEKTYSAENNEKEILSK